MHGEKVQRLAMVITRLRRGDGNPETLLVMGRNFNDCLRITEEGLAALRIGDNLPKSLRDACGPTWGVSESQSLIIVKEATA
ncbi:MAG: hypothetical protein NWE76_10715 [Candidatus Bathyarchaeota archaeon]|nr:hypothetical protein [Candidatus Bathyarchaeota archaeon]